MKIETFFIKRGDTSPALQFALLPATVNLTGATVRFQMRARRPRGGVAVIDAAAAVVTATGTPTVEYKWQPSNTINAGSYEAEFRVTYPNGEIGTFPNDGFIPIQITEDIQ
jgi:hypothetical protein